MRRGKFKAALLLILLISISCKKNAVDQDDGTLAGKEATYVYSHPVNLYSLGYPGYQTTDLYAVEPDVFKTNPDLIIVMCGTNDVFTGSDVNYTTNLVKLISDLRKGSTADIMLLTPPTFTDSYNNSRMDMICTAVRNISAEQKCLLVDVNSLFKKYESTKGPLLLSDGTHPTVAGYTIIASAIFQVYVDNKLSKYNIACLGDSITNGAFMIGAGTATGDTYPGQLSALLNKH